MTETLLEQRSDDAQMSDILALLKPRVMALAVFTAATGLLVAPTHTHPVIAGAAILFIALGAGACGALNMWWDADIDASMKRTRGRPIPTGAVERDTALALGLGLAALSVMMLALTANLLAAAILAVTIAHYVVGYSMILKRTTPHNIVIGGAAGALPPVIGWAAATGDIAIEAILMFLVIFLWTPPHSWALALFTGRDYETAGVPMLTVTDGHDAVRRKIRLYALLLVPVTLLLAFSSIGGPVFLACAIILNFLFVKSAFRLAEAGPEGERQFFLLSLIYLFVLFAALIIDAGLGEVIGDTVWPRWS